MNIVEITFILTIQLLIVVVDEVVMWLFLQLPFKIVKFLLVLPF